VRRSPPRRSPPRRSYRSRSPVRDRGDRYDRYDRGDRYDRRASPPRHHLPPPNPNRGRGFSLFIAGINFRHNERVRGAAGLPCPPAWGQSCCGSGAVLRRCPAAAPAPAARARQGSAAGGRGRAAPTSHPP
jgi:hypothetical protein